MGWLGSTVGWFCGNRFGGILGGLAGAVLGGIAESVIRGLAAEDEKPSSAPRGRRTAQRIAREREVIFLTAVGAMLAKLSKADGRIDQSEIDAGERAFVRLGLTPEKREFCIRAFRSAKADGHSIFDYAEAFAEVVDDSDIRELVYDILWDVACADGVLSPEEQRILELIVRSLRIRPSLYSEEYARRIRGGSRSGGSRRSSHAPESSSQPDPYEVIGCARTATDAEVRKAYREKAKKLHPDILRAQGLPEEMLSRANEQMGRVNAAWDQIKKERGL